MALLFIDFSSIHHFIVEVVLLILLLIGAYKVVMSEIPKEWRSSKRVRQKTQAKDE